MTAFVEPFDPLYHVAFSCYDELILRDKFKHIILNCKTLNIFTPECNTIYSLIPMFYKEDEWLNLIYGKQDDSYEITVNKCFSGIDDNDDPYLNMK
ncbi:hypothetical protein H8356DRAFT_1323645 [Neocallimastix lanati (nom. inval.)]|nr:hypothetical protein H8356DRAFT_1323645 [Neocallimastix sp. JGI-2020a]